MKILFDEDAPRPLRRHLPGHEISTVQEMGWAGVQNGELLNLVEINHFDVLLTFDQNLRHQQNLTGRPFALVIVIVPNKQMKTLTLLLPGLISTLQSTQPGQVYELRSP